MLIATYKSLAAGLYKTTVLLHIGICTKQGHLEVFTVFFFLFNQESGFTVNYDSYDTVKGVTLRFFFGLKRTLR